MNCQFNRLVCTALIIQICMLKNFTVEIPLVKSTFINYVYLVFFTILQIVIHFSISLVLLCSNNFIRFTYFYKVFLM